MYILYFETNTSFIKFKYFDIYWYGIIYFSIFLFFYFFLNHTKFLKKKQSKYIKNIFFKGFIISTVGSKFGFLLFYQPSILIIDYLSVFKIWLPGRSFYGGILFFLFFYFEYVFYKNKKFLLIYAKNILVLPIFIFLGRAANFINGELFGKITNQDCGIIYSYVDNNLRHASQIYEAILEGILLLLILIIYNKFNKHKYNAIYFTILVYSILRFSSEYFREVDYFIINYIFKYRFTLSQILSIITCQIILIKLTLNKNYETIFKLVKRYNEQRNNKKR